MSVKQKERDLLCTKSGNRCAMPDCHVILVKDVAIEGSASLIAEAAHIKGEKPSSARYDANMTDDERNSYNNLILLCPSCHTKIDKQSNTYPIELLQRYKNEHELWITTSTKNEVINVTFAELDLVIKYIISNQGIKNESLTLIPPKDKIAKNGLSQNIEQMILIGMTQVKQVATYIANIAAFDVDFIDRFINGFVFEYKRLHDDEGINGDILFEKLLDFSCGGSSDFKQRAAGLSVLVYLFEKCEVFEK